MKAWRITSRKYAQSAFTGEGAARHPGRWNRREGIPVIYLTCSLAVGILEILVHLSDRSYLSAYLAIPVEIPDDFIERLLKLPRDWQQLPEPYPESTQALGTTWAQSQRSLALQVPSAVVPSEYNLVLNPKHPDIHQLTTGNGEPLVLDPRLLK
jgi:RES domain-containing protein